MKLKDIVQIAVLTVIGFAIGMAVSMFTGTLGAIALYASAGFAAFVVGPVFVIMAKKNSEERSCSPILDYIWSTIFSDGILDYDSYLPSFSNIGRNYNR